ncbi:MAG TPA: glycosyltransferase family A protein [Anaerolineales bacterium]|nr:glycosyltransferase family A protein [Anaerolineales bacterium]
MRPKPGRVQTRNRKSPRCSIVIRAYNEERHVARLLVGILHQTVRPVEILMVDSGSTDATLAIASRYPVRVLHLDPASFSFGRSLNLGCAAARGEFIVVASAHVYPVYPDWLERLLEPFADPQVAGVYGKQRGDTTTRFSEHQVFRQWFPETSIDRQDSAFCNNANAAIRRSLWQRHPYSEELPALEDVDWAAWAMSQGFHIAYRAEAEVIHVHDEDAGAVFNRYRREAMALKRIRPQEHFGLTDLVRLLATHVRSDVREAVRQGLARQKLKEILWFRWMQYWGTYRGFATAGPLTGQLKEAFYYPRRADQHGAAPARSVSPLDYAELAPPHDTRTRWAADERAR